MTRDISLTNFNEQSGRYGFAIGSDGDVAFDDTAAFAVMNVTMSHRGKYWASRAHGSLLYTLRNLSSSTASQAEAMQRDALAPLERDNIIEGVNVAATVDPATNRLDIETDWTTPGGAGGSAAVSV